VAMNYMLLDKWAVKVDCQVIVADVMYNWSFAFSVAVKVGWIEVMDIAKVILKERFGERGWNILGFELTNTN